MSSMFIEDIMPLISNQDDYLKDYIDESLPLFDKLNTIIKKGNSTQRQALINNLNSYAHDSLFSNLIQFIITDIGSWEIESINLFPKSLYHIIINNTLDNELFNTIFRNIIINITTGADQTKAEYTIYFDKIIEHFRPTKTSYEIYNNINIVTNKEFPYKLNVNIFELILSLGIFGQSPTNRRLCCYLSSSLCRLLIQNDEDIKDNNIQDENVQKMFQRMSKLSDDPDIIIEMQMVRELQYLLPLFKEIIMTDKEFNKALDCYVKLDWDHVPQSMTIICLLNNILIVEPHKILTDLLLEKIKEIIEEKEYEINYKNDIMDCLIHCLYNNYKLIPKVVNQVLELGIIEYYVNKLCSLDTFGIIIKNFDKIYFIMNNLDETYSTYTENISEINTNITNTCMTNITNICTCTSNTSINNNLLNSFTQTQITDIKNQSKIVFDELFIKIYNKLYNTIENSESNSSNSLSLSKIDSNETKGKYLWEENKTLLFKYLANIFHCIFFYQKINKQLIDSVFDLFKKESISNILNYYCKENNEHEQFYKKKKNKLYKLLHFFVKNNYKKYISNINNISNSCNNIGGYNKELIFENNIYNKLFILLLNNIFFQIDELQKSSNSNICLLIANSLLLLIPKIYKYYKNIVIIVQNNNVNYIINNITMKENNTDNRIFYLEKILEDIFNKIISVIILNKGLGFFIKKEFVKLMPYIILYSYNRNKYLEFVRKEIISSDNFFMRKFSLVFIQTCLENYSFEFIKKMKIYDDIISLMKDEVNIISTGILNLIYQNIKKIIAYSNDVFHELCEEIKEIYNINIQKFNNDTKNFDKEKNIIINKILNIKDSTETNDSQYLQSDELNQIKETQNRLSIIENDIINFETNFHKIKHQKKGDNSENNKNNIEVTRSIFQRISSTSTSFQAIKNNTNISGISNTSIFNQFYHIPFNTRVNVKKNSLTDKTSNILKSLTSKNITNNKHYLPKIKGKRKDSNVGSNNANNICNINSNNINNNLFVIKANNGQINKVICGEKDKEKIFLKNKKLNPVPKNRTPSAKAPKGNSNSPVNHGNNNNMNSNCEEFFYKAKTSKKSISNKNINYIFKQSQNKSNMISLQKDYNNNIFAQGSNKIYINAEKTNTSIASSK